MATRYIEKKRRTTGGVRNPETPASRITNRPSTLQIKPGDIGSSYTITESRAAEQARKRRQREPLNQAQNFVKSAFSNAARIREQTNGPVGNAFSTGNRIREVINNRNQANQTRRKNKKILER